MTMINDAEKITRFKQLIETTNGSKNLEAVGLALSIEDEEERDLYLLQAARLFLNSRDWQRAHGVTELMTNSYEKAETLRQIAEFLASIGHIERSLLIFDDAEAASVAEHFSHWQQAELLHQIANSLAQVNAKVRADDVRSRAIGIAQTGQQSASEQDSIDSSSVLADIVENLAAEERIEEALQIAQSIKSVGKRERALLQISEYSSNVKRVA